MLPVVIKGAPGPSEAFILTWNESEEYLPSRIPAVIIFPSGPSPSTVISKSLSPENIPKSFKAIKVTKKAIHAVK